MMPTVESLSRDMCADLCHQRDSQPFPKRVYVYHIKVKLFI